MPIRVPNYSVKNHSIPQSAIDDAVAAGKRFFSLPLESKKALDIHKTGNFKGYTALLGENTNPENRGDLHEGFDLGWEEFSGKGRAADEDGAMGGGNVWPEGLPGFREACLEY